MPRYKDFANTGPGAKVYPADLNGIQDDYDTKVAAAKAASVNDGDTAGGDLAGTYPNPTFKVDMATQAELNAHTAATIGAHGGIVASTDPRLDDARSPTAHTGRHWPRGSDSLWTWHEEVTANGGVTYVNDQVNPGHVVEYFVRITRESDDAYERVYRVVLCHARTIFLKVFDLGGHPQSATATFTMQNPGNNGNRQLLVTGQTPGSGFPYRVQISGQRVPASFAVAALAPVGLHAGDHGTNGRDPISPASIGASAAGHTHTLASLGAAPSAVEAFREVGATGQPAFQNSWVNKGGTDPTAAFYKDPYGRVQLKGWVTAGGPGASAFTLPVGYRPARRLAMPILVGDGSGFAAVHITAAGEVVPYSGSTSYAALDGVVFRAEA